MLDECVCVCVGGVDDQREHDAGPRRYEMQLLVCELATILILFVQTDPVPFYFQLVENKLVLFLLSVAMTTQPLFFFLVDLGKSRKSK